MRLQTHDDQHDYPDLVPCPQCATTERLCHNILFNAVSIDMFKTLTKEAQTHRGWADALIENINGGYRLIGPWACECPPQPKSTNRRKPKP